MVDEIQIRKKYEKLKNENDTRLIPYEKVLKLEAAKIFIREKILKKIIQIDSEFKISFSDPGLSDLFLKEKCIKYFGQLNFEDKKEEYGKLIIVMAFDYCLIEIIFFQNVVKQKITVFWDS